MCPGEYYSDLPIFQACSGRSLLLNMNSINPQKRTPTYALLQVMLVAALLLRVAVPAGFMPASADDGWYLKLCPDGVPTEIMEALFGHDHSHHQGGHEQTFVQCELGSVLGGEGIVGTFAETTPDFDAGLPVVDVSPTFILASFWYAFRSRAPPHSSLI
jgi:hypothetical protein